MTPRTRLAWFGPLHDMTGFADEARGFLRAMEAAGQHPAARDLNWSTGTVPLGAADQAMLDTQTRRDFGPPVVAVHACLPWHGQLHVSDAVNVGRAMFETDSLPASWVAPMLAREEIWVPSQHNVETFRRGGLPEERLHVLGETIDFDLFDPEVAEPWPFDVEDGRFVFFSNFDFNDRKGWQQLLLAWAQAFTADDPVQLVLKTGNLVKGDAYARGRIDEFLAAHVGPARARMAPIELVTLRLDAPEMPRLYAAADAFVVASRGEGWGRPYMEAMAMGVPTVGPRFGGSLEFMNDGNSFLFDGELVTIPADVEVWGGLYTGHRWLEPDVDSLASILRAIAADPEAARARAAGARAELIERFGPVAIAARLAELTEGALERAARATGVPVSIRGLFGSNASLAVVNDALAHELGKRGSAVTLRPLGAPATDAPHAGISHGWPPNFEPATAGPSVVVLPWEYGPAPAEWVREARSRLDRVWVPSEYVRQGYIAGGMPPGVVEVVPNGVDLERFGPDGPARELPPAGCRFLFVGGSIWRKGVDLLVAAWREAFAPGDDVQLVIKDSGTNSHYQGQNAGASLRALAERGETAPVVYLDEELDPAELPDLYRACDVLVVPYRGEGFCLPALEAMACGLPVIHTGVGPTPEFVPADGGWAVPARQVMLGAEAKLPELSAPGWVHEIDPAALAEALRAAAADPAERQARAARALAAAAGRGWPAVAEIAERSLRTLAEEGLPLAREIASADLEAREHVVVYAPDWTDEAAWAPPLLRWCAEVGADEPVTLALYLEGVDPDALVGRILDRLADAGHAEDELPDLAVCAPESAPLHSLVAIGGAVLLDERQCSTPPARLVRRAARVLDGEPAVEELLIELRAAGAPAVA